MVMWSMNFEPLTNKPRWGRSRANCAVDFKAHALTGLTIGTPAQTDIMTQDEKMERCAALLDGLFESGPFEMDHVHANSEGTYSFDFRHREEGTLIKFLNTLDPATLSQYHDLGEDEDVLLIIDTVRLPANEITKVCKSCGMPYDALYAAMALDALIYHDGEVVFPEDYFEELDDENNLDETEI